MDTAKELPDSVRALPATKQQLEKRFYRPRQVAFITGASPSEVFRWITRGELEAYQRGRSWYVPVEAVDRFIKGEQAA